MALFHHRVHPDDEQRGRRAATAWHRIFLGISTGVSRGPTAPSRSMGVGRHLWSALQVMAAINLSDPASGLADFFARRSVSRACCASRPSAAMLPALYAPISQPRPGRDDRERRSGAGDPRLLHARLGGERWWSRNILTRCSGVIRRANETAWWRTACAGATSKMRRGCRNREGDAVQCTLDRALHRLHVMTKVRLLRARSRTRSWHRSSALCCHDRSLCRGI